MLTTGIHGRIQRRLFYESSDNFQSLALALLERNLKKMDFIKDEFLHKKINKKKIYVDATEDIPEDVCRLKQYRDLTVLY